jgi:hypothetical protein
MWPFRRDHSNETCLYQIGDDDDGNTRYQLYDCEGSTPRWGGITTVRKTDKDKKGKKR